MVRSLGRAVPGPAPIRLDYTVAYATTADVETLWRALLPDEVALWTTRLDVATMWLDVWWPTLNTAVTTGVVPELLVKELCISLVRRSLREDDREDAVSVSDAAGPFAFSVRYRTPDATMWLFGKEAGAVNGLLFGTATAKSVYGAGL